MQSTSWETLVWMKHKLESACNAGDTGDAGLIPESGRSPRGGHGNPLQYCCMKNFMDRGAWGCKESDRTEQLSMHTYTLDTLSCVSCTRHGSTNSVKHICPGVLAEAGQGYSAPVNTVSWSESLWCPLGVLSHFPPGVTTGHTMCKHGDACVLASWGVFYCKAE